MSSLAVFLLKTQKDGNTMELSYALTIGNNTTSMAQPIPLHGQPPQIMHMPCQRRKDGSHDSSREDYVPRCRANHYAVPLYRIIFKRWRTLKGVNLSTTERMGLDFVILCKLRIRVGRPQVGVDVDPVGVPKLYTL